MTSTASAPAGYSHLTAASAASIASASIISTAAGTMPAAMMSLTAPPASSMLWKPTSIVCTDSGTRTMPERDLGRDAEGALAAHEGPEQVVAGMLRRRPAEVHHLAAGEHDGGSHDVVDGEAVFQTVRTAGVLGDVAADGADLLRGGIGRVRKVERRTLAGHPQIDDARLDDDPGVVGVDRHDPPHARHDDEHALGDRQRAARQTGPGPAGDERHPCLGAEAKRVDHVLRRLGQHDDRRRHPEVRRARRTRTCAVGTWSVRTRCASNGRYAGRPRARTSSASERTACVVTRSAQPLVRRKGQELDELVGERDLLEQLAGLLVAPVVELLGPDRLPDLLELLVSHLRGRSRR